MIFSVWINSPFLRNRKKIGHYPTFWSTRSDSTDLYFSIPRLLFGTSKDPDVFPEKARVWLQILGLFCPPANVFFFGWDSCSVFGSSSSSTSSSSTSTSSKSSDWISKNSVCEFSEIIFAFEFCSDSYKLKFARKQSEVNYFRWKRVSRDCLSTPRICAPSRWLLEIQLWVLIQVFPKWRRALEYMNTLGTIFKSKPLPGLFSEQSNAHTDGQDVLYLFDKYNHRIIFKTMNINIYIFNK